MGIIRLFILLIHFASMCLAFLPNFWSRVLTLSWDSYTHQYMTEQALLNITMETINMMPEHFGGQEQVRAAGWCYITLGFCLWLSNRWLYNCFLLRTHITVKMYVLKTQYIQHKIFWHRHTKALPIYGDSPGSLVIFILWWISALNIASVL